MELYIEDAGLPCYTSKNMTKVIENRLLGRIRQDPRVLAGKPVIAGTRLSVDALLTLMAEGLSEEQILGEYPRLKHEDIQAALLYAGNVVRNESVFPLSVRQPKR
jgi:uncharacterized protein (DUF433 family)